MHKSLLSIFDCDSLFKRQNLVPHFGWTDLIDNFFLLLKFPHLKFRKPTIGSYQTMQRYNQKYTGDAQHNDCLCTNFHSFFQSNIVYLFVGIERFDQANYNILHISKMTLTIVGNLYINIYFLSAFIIAKN